LRRYDAHGELRSSRRLDVAGDTVRGLVAGPAGEWYVLAFQTCSSLGLSWCDPQRTETLPVILRLDADGSGP